MTCLRSHSKLSEPVLEREPEEGRGSQPSCGIHPGPLQQLMVTVNLRTWPREGASEPPARLRSARPPPTGMRVVEGGDVGRTPRAAATAAQIPPAFPSPGPRVCSKEARAGGTALEGCVASVFAPSSSRLPALRFPGKAGQDPGGKELYPQQHFREWLSYMKHLSSGT